MKLLCDMNFQCHRMKEVRKVLVIKVAESISLTWLYPVIVESVIRRKKRWRNVQI